MVSAGPSNPEWMEISIHADPVAHEALSAVLFSLGCTGMVMDNCGDGIVKAYFPIPDKPEETRETMLSSIRELAHHFPHMSPPEILFTSMQDQDWGKNWRQFFRTERVTPFLTIVPAWESVPEETGAAVIRMDPGPAFGTGKHPSTRLCLRAMELAAKPSSWNLLDVGTGSGILAIYGSMLGAKKIKALDIDEDALHWAEKNIRLNGLGEQVECSSRPLAALKDHFFMVTANLILHTILDLMGHFSQVVKPGGWLILSGLLEDQIDLVNPSLEECGFIREKTLSQEDWACLLARKPG
ncbi:MAG: 50S ribosomal protein L11 methyltransferase [Deltaproteobacteria bacterium]|nr:50S ribosomal protein L11 methyltransferase [Deltaproteobacteria bacterium]